MTCCETGEHPFKQIIKVNTGDGYGVVRWCPKCGAIVIDYEYDNRTMPGFYMKLTYPEITYKHGCDKDD